MEKTWTQRQSLITFDCDKRLSQFKRIPSYCVCWLFFSILLFQSHSLSFFLSFFPKLDGENAISLSLYHSDMIHESLPVYRISNLSIFRYDLTETFARLCVYVFGYIVSFHTYLSRLILLGFGSRLLLSFTHADGKRKKERKRDTNHGVVCFLYHGKPQKCLLRPNKKKSGMEKRELLNYIVSVDCNHFESSTIASSVSVNIQCFWRGIKTEEEEWQRHSFILSCVTHVSVS